MPRRQQLTISPRDKRIRKAIERVDGLINCFTYTETVFSAEREAWVIGCLMNKALSNFKGVLRLLRRGFLAEALILMRSAYETTIVLCYFRLNPEEHIQNFKTSTNNAALKEMKISIENGWLPSDDADLLAFMETLRSDRAQGKEQFTMKFLAFLTALRSEHPELFDVGAFSATDTVLYIYGSQIVHSNPHRVREFYFVEPPNINIGMILRGILCCLGLLKFAMQPYGFPDHWEYGRLLKKAHESVLPIA